MLKQQLEVWPGSYSPKSLDICNSSRSWCNTLQSKCVEILNNLLCGNNNWPFKIRAVLEQKKFFFWLVQTFILSTSPKSPGHDRFWGLSWGQTTPVAVHRNLDLVRSVWPRNHKNNAYINSFVTQLVQQVSPAFSHGFVHIFWNVRLAHPCPGHTLER